MPNIFDGLRKVSDSDLIEQIALLDTINMINISKPIAQKAKKSTINILNFIGNKIGKKQMLKETEVKEIWTLVDEKKEVLNNCTRKELNQKLLDVIREKIKNPVDDILEDEISVQIIEEAAKLYKVNENYTIAYKADNVYLKYSEKHNGKEDGYLEEQELIDLKKTTEIVEDTLRDIGKEKKKNLEHAIDIESLTLLNAWRNVDRQLFARLVWLSVKACGGRFTVKVELLPSYLDNNKDTVRIDEEKELQEAQVELLQLENKIQLSKEKINSIEISLQEKSNLINTSIINKKQIEEELVSLEQMHLKFEEIKKVEEEKIKEIKAGMEDALLDKLDILMEDFKKVKFDSININNKISDIKMDITYKIELVKNIEKEIEINEKSVSDIGSEVQNFKLEANTILKDYNEKKEEVKKKEDYIRKEIFDRWSKFFHKFRFEFENLKSIVKFSREELIRTEECLYELHFTNNPRALSMGIIEDKTNKELEYLYIDASYPNKINIEVQYMVENNKDKKIHIFEINNEF